jgi:hypothetical protein
MPNIKEIAKDCFRNLIGFRSLESIEINVDEASKLIEKGLNSDHPFLCSRLGCTELQSIIFAKKAKIFPLNIGLANLFWKDVLRSLHYSSGVFGIDKHEMYLFADLYISLMKEIDILGSWHPSETYFINELKHCIRIRLGDIGPDVINESWIKSLFDKKVLVISPFTDTIKKQYYNKRTELFENKNILPQFRELKLLKAVQSIAGECPQKYKNWFDALEAMHEQMNAIDYDIALIGAGAYGFPLGCYAKQCGKKAIVIGGPLQLLFGIKGSRWEAYPEINKIMQRPAWVNPSPEETPKYINRVPRTYW